jgi:RNA polymerase sigma-70 factor (ECF subfamily)
MEKRLRVWLLEDRQRLDGFRQGNPKVLEAVYLHYAPLLAKRFVYKFKAYKFGFFELDDLVQETFVRAFSHKARQSYDGLRSYLPFLFTIGRNLLLDHLRRDKKDQLAKSFEEINDSAQEVEPNLFSQERDPEEQAQDKQIWELYERFLDGLSKSDRKLWHLRLEEKLPRSEVEKALGLTSMRLRTREKRLRQKLLDMLLDQGINVGRALSLLGLI